MAISGMVKMVINPLTTVIDRESATFPRIMKFTRLEVAPPGQMEMRISPTASSAWSPVTHAMAKAIMGSNSSWLNNPTEIFLG